MALRHTRIPTSCEFVKVRNNNNNNNNNISIGWTDAKLDPPVAA